LSTRALPTFLTTSGLLLGLTAATIAPAAAQGTPVGGEGNRYFLAGAGNETGTASVEFVYGDAGDEVYFGDFVDEAGTFGGDGRDDAMVRRGNSFIIRGQNGRVFHYGDRGDTVLVGDWDGDGTDTLAVRRGNRFFVKNDIDTGVADYEFVYGDPGDRILVGNWDGDTSAEDAEVVEITDTIMVQRGNRFFVKNDTTTGVADYDFYYGDPGDTILVGDWAYPAVYGDAPDTAERETDHLFPGRSGDHADQLAVRRGNVYHLSDEVWLVGMEGSSSLATMREFAYGDATDTAFTAQLDNTFEFEDGTQETLYGDGLAVRRR